MMQVHTSTIGDATVLSCDGRLTMVAAPTLRSAIDDAVSDGRVRRRRRPGRHELRRLLRARRPRRGAQAHPPGRR